MARLVQGHQTQRILARRARARRSPTQKGDKVVFSVSDAFLPESDEARSAFIDEGEVVGTVLDFSDSGEIRQAFALVEIIRQQTLVVPVGKLRPAPGSRGCGAGST